MREQRSEERKDGRKKKITQNEKQNKTKKTKTQKNKTIQQIDAVYQFMLFFEQKTICVEDTK